METVIGWVFKLFAEGVLLRWADAHQAWIVLVLCIVGLLYLLHQGWLANKDWVHEALGLMVAGFFIVVALGAGWVLMGRPGAGLFRGDSQRPAAPAPTAPQRWTPPPIGPG